MSEIDDQDHEAVPEGMERRTRRVRKKRKGKKSASEGEAHSDTLFARAKDLLVGMHNEDEDHGHVDVAEQVRRLQQKKEDERPLDDVWGTKKRSASWLWIVLVGLIASIVAVIIAVTMWISDDPRPESNGLTDLGSPIGTVVDDDLGKGPLGWFNDNSIEVLEDVREIIEIVNKAEDGETIAKVVRESVYRDSNPLSPDMWGSDFLTTSTSNFSWISKVVNSSRGAGEVKTGYLQVSGTRVDGNPYEAYFVPGKDGLLLDWDATMGLSEFSVSEIAKEKPRKEIYLRCRVSKKPSYDQEFGNVKYSGYVISGEVSDEFFLAYVPLNTKRGKVIDRDLRFLLNYGSFVSGRPPLRNQKATIRVRYGDDSGKKDIFEIVEFLYDGWVSP